VAFLLLLSLLLLQLNLFPCVCKHFLFLCIHFFTVSFLYISMGLLFCYLCVGDIYLFNKYLLVNVYMCICQMLFLHWGANRDLNHHSLSIYDIAKVVLSVSLSLPLSVLLSVSHTHTHTQIHTNDVSWNFWYPHQVIKQIDSEIYPVSYRLSQNFIWDLFNSLWFYEIWMKIYSKPLVSVDLCFQENHYWGKKSWILRIHRVHYSKLSHILSIPYMH
jgi:hypothetical protein